MVVFKDCCTQQLFPLDLQGVIRVLFAWDRSELNILDIFEDVEYVRDSVEVSLVVMFWYSDPVACFASSLMKFIDEVEHWSWLLFSQVGDEGDLARDRSVKKSIVLWISLWDEDVLASFCSSRSPLLYGLDWIWVNQFSPKLSPSVFNIDFSVLCFDLSLSFLLDIWLLSHLARESCFQHCVYFEESVDQDNLSVTSSSDFP